VADATGAWLARKRSAAWQLFEIWTRPSAAEKYVAGHGGAGYFFSRVISWLMPYLSNSAQKRGVKQKRLFFWYKLVAAGAGHFSVAKFSKQCPPWLQ